MALNYNPYYQELCTQMNPYIAVMEMAEVSRRISGSLGNRVLYSTALDYAAKDQLPDPKDFPDHRLDRVKEYLTYVDDLEVRSAVIASYEQSLSANNLVYDYKCVNDDPRKARVRIIMNILWDSRPHKNS